MNNEAGAPAHDNLPRAQLPYLSHPITCAAPTGCNGGAEDEEARSQAHAGARESSRRGSGVIRWECMGLHAWPFAVSIRD